MYTTKKRVMRALGIASAVVGLVTLGTPSVSAADAPCNESYWDCEIHWGGNTYQVQNSHNNSDFQSWLWVNDESADGRGAFFRLVFRGDPDGTEYRRPWDNDGANNGGFVTTYTRDVYAFKVCEEGSGLPDACSGWIYPRSV
ncbi:MULTISPECIES: hypothetical protein [unclassified Streptomyces]|uniref:hypothetical protein n=1 Tax=unclassified Streptomyces TaxID=2593676 RepID=UPI002965E61D|nr:hypothetical protein [Streptomyces sp. SJL17-1]